MAMPGSTPRIQSIQVGLPQDLGSDDSQSHHERPWRTAFFKQPVAGEVEATTLGIVGDGVADTQHHGGVDKAILAYSLDHFPYWQEKLGRDNLAGGAFGENLTVSGLTEHEVCIGDTWQAGEVLLGVSQPRQPCWKLSRRWQVDDLAAQVTKNGRTGWYLRVVREGRLSAGLILTLVSRKHPDWTIARANEIWHHDKKNLQAAAELAALAELSETWQEKVLQRVQKHRESATPQSSTPQSS